jgi:CheY-like chemotaxis protein
MLVAFLTDDLVFPSRVKAVAERFGVDLKTAGTVDALVELVGDGQAVVIVDLSMPLDVEATIGRLKALGGRPRAVVAFCPHVHEAKLQAAKAAGCDVVLTRGQFDAQMENVLGQFLAQSGGC